MVLISNSITGIKNVSGTQVNPAKEDGNLSTISTNSTTSGANLNDIYNVLNQIRNSQFIRAISNTNGLPFVDVSAGGGFPSGTSAMGAVATRPSLLAAPYVDSTANLATTAAFTGTGRDAQISSSSPFTYFGVFQCCVISDQAGTLGVEESSDNATFYPVENVNTSAVINAAGTSLNSAMITHKISQRYVRLFYKNTSGSTTTILQIYSRVQGLL